MASQAIWSLLVLLFAVSCTHTLTYDEEATNDAIAASSAREENEVAITLRGPQGGLGREELLHAKDTSDHVVSLFYNSQNNKVFFESLNGGHLKSVSWGLGSHQRGTLVLVVTHNRVRLYAGCKPLRWHPMSGRHDVLALLASRKLKLYHEENAPMEIFDNERTALDSIKCYAELNLPSLMAVDSDVEEVDEFIKKEETRKQERRQEMREEMQGDDYRTNFIDPNIRPGMATTPGVQRGDVPAVDIESCDDEVIRQLKLLRQTVELLRRELADQKGSIDGLKSQLRACCSRVPAPPVDRCASGSCYPGY